MAMARKNGREMKCSLAMLRLIMQKLQTGLSLLRRPHFDDEELEEGAGAAAGVTQVPKDVKEGHFVVLAIKGGKPKRFVVDLGYLTNPEFLKLLEQAEEEFGFEQKGALAVPCRPDDLQRILGCRR